MAFMPKVSAPSMRGSARKPARVSRGSFPSAPVAGLTLGMVQARARLDELQAHQAFGGVDLEFVDVVFVPGLQAVQHQIGPEAVHAHRRLPACRHTLVQGG